MRETIPAAPHTAELVVRRSRFVATAQLATSRAEVDSTLQHTRTNHASASHVVYAFVIGSANSTLEGMSDDGEPHGTAGRPVLDVLRGSGVTDCLITVVRYFGGTKLGTGGLVRAYSEAARASLVDLPVEERRTLVFAELSVPYELYREVRETIEAYDGAIAAEQFESAVTMKVGVDEAAVEAVQAALRDVSRGTIDACFT